MLQYKREAVRSTRVTKRKTPHNFHCVFNLRIHLALSNLLNFWTNSVRDGYPKSRCLYHENPVSLPPRGRCTVGRRTRLLCGPSRVSYRHQTCW